MKKRKKIPNWFIWLKKAKKKEPSERECFHALRLAERWATCAFGEQCKAIPRGKTGEPVDAILYKMGLDFMWNIRHRNWRGAILTLKSIEKRSADLLEWII
jgi:hypothetical protein